MRWCIVHLDDIIIYSDTKEEHLKRLEAVFQKLVAAGLKLKPLKCFFFMEEIEYLGHVVSEKGIFTNPKKVEAVTSGLHHKLCLMLDLFLVLLDTIGDLSRILARFQNQSEK